MLKGERKRKAIQRVMTQLQKERLPCIQSLLWPVLESAITATLRSRTTYLTCTSAGGRNRLVPHLCRNRLQTTSQQPPKPDINTSVTTSIAALEASNERVQLLSGLGYDIATLALDTAESAGTVGSIEQMLAHQVVAAHHQATTILVTGHLMPAMYDDYMKLAA